MGVKLNPDLPSSRFTERTTRLEPTRTGLTASPRYFADRASATQLVRRGLTAIKCLIPAFSTNCFIDIPGFKQIQKQPAPRTHKVGIIQKLIDLNWSNAKL
jgi:hypothetical protein